MAIDINLGRLAAYVRLDFSRLKGDQAKAGKSLSDFAKKMNREMSESFAAMGRSMSLSLTAPLVGVGKMAVDAAVQMDTLKRSLNAITGSSKETAEQMKRLEAIGRLPGLAFKEAVEGSVNLQAAGFSARMAEKALMGFGNALAQVGKGRDDLREVVINLQQMASAGKVTADEIKETAQRVPQMRKAMEAVFGTSNTELIQKANISGKEFVEAMSTYFVAHQKTVQGAKTEMENFQESITKTFAALGDAILPDLLKQMKAFETGLQSFTTWWKGLGDGTRTNIVRFGEVLALLGPLSIGVGVFTSAITKLSAAFTTLRAVMTALPFASFSTGIAAAVGGVALFSKYVADMRQQQIDKAGNKAFAARVKAFDAIPADALKARLQREKEIVRQDRERQAQMMRSENANRRRLSPQQLRALSLDVRDYDAPLSAFQPKGSVFDVRAMEQSLKAREESARTAKQASAEMDAIIKKMQDRMAKAGSAGDAKKAEAAARRQQAARDRRGDLLDRVMRTAGNISQSGFGSWLQEMTAGALGQARSDEALRKSRAKASDKMGGGFGSFNSAMSGMSDMNRALREFAQARQKKAAAGASKLFGNASSSLSGAMGMLSPMAQKAAEETAARQIALQDKVAAHQLRMGNLSLQQYRSYLANRLEAVRGNIEEEMRLKEDISEIDRRIGDAKTQEAEMWFRERFKGWQNLAAGIQGVFANAFQGVLEGSKDFFQGLLDGFKQMLAQMVAQGLAVGLMRAVFGGPGGFLGGFTSIFGFDNAANDAKAHRWGRDFSHHFTDGAVEYGRTRAVQGASRMAGAGVGTGGEIHVSVSIGNFNNHTDADVQRLGEQIGKATRDALRRRV